MKGCVNRVLSFSAAFFHVLSMIVLLHCHKCWCVSFLFYILDMVQFFDGFFFVSCLCLTIHSFIFGWIWGQRVTVSWLPFLVLANLCFRMWFVSICIWPLCIVGSHCFPSNCLLFENKERVTIWVKSSQKKAHITFIPFFLSQVPPILNSCGH